jgi:hypothetical protein
MKKTFTLSVLFAFYFLTTTHSYAVASVCPGNIVLSSQADVNAFNCSEVTGDLIISGEDITSLQPLAALQKVSGNLLIEINTNLKTLDGLSALSRIEGYLSIRYDTVLQNLDGLSGLTHAGGVYILDNFDLSSLNGLSSLTEVNGPLSIQYNSDLMEIGGFTLLQSIHGELRIANNDNLEHVSGFANLTAVGQVSIANNSKLIAVKGFESMVAIKDDLGAPGSLSIEANGALTNLDGFSKLSSVNHFNINGNPHLSDLKGFSSLREISGDIYINENPELVNINALSYIDSIGANLWIQNNDKLLNLDAFASLTYVGSLAIYENENLSSINGLSNVKEIGTGMGSSVWISNNDALTHVDGFSSVKKIKGPVQIKYNPALETVNGFAALAELEGHIEVSNNEVLTTVNGFKTLAKLSNSSFGVGLIISQNPLLTELDGFSSLKTIDGYARVFVEIGDNPLLTNINGLSKLTTISAGGRGVSVSIYRNAALKNIDGLSSLSTFNVGFSGGLSITDNTALENIDGLSGLRGSISDPPLYITVTRNSSLTKCDGLYPYFASLGEDEVLKRVNNGTIVIAENGAGCTVEDILAAGSLSILSFTVIDGRTGDEVRSFANDSVLLDIADPNFIHWVIQAKTLPDHAAKSVEFRFDQDPSNFDNEEPFVFTLPSYQPGSHTLMADVYSGENGKGIKGIGKSSVVQIINSAVVISFDVVDSSGKILMPLTENAQINIKDQIFKTFSIRANTKPDTVSNVKFWLNDKLFRVEDVVPYAFNGDVNGVFNNWNTSPGGYTIRAVPFIKIGGEEYAGKPLSVHFDVVSDDMNTLIVNFEIVDTLGNKLAEVKNGDEIDINDPKFKAITIIAKTTSQVGSVKFHLNGEHFSTENEAPFTLTRDQNGYFNPWSSAAGDYTLSATPYSETDGSGIEGKTFTIAFSVVDKNIVGIETPSNSETPATNGLDVTLYPVPVGNELFVDIADQIGEGASLTIANIHGISVYTGIYSRSSSINTIHLHPGVYFLRVDSGMGVPTIRKFIKK